MTFDAITLTLNPAIDRFVVISDFKTGSVNRVTEVRSNPGGKGVNVASALADHGFKIAVTGFLGRENPASFERLFAQKQIDDSFIRIAGQTRVGIKITDPISKKTTDINFPGATPSATDLENLYEKLACLEAPWFVLAGSLPPGVPETIYRDLIAKLKAVGKKVVLDASGMALRQALIASPSIIKPNIHELEELVGQRLTTDNVLLAAVRTLLAGGIELVVVSMGDKGAYFVSKDETLFAKPPAVEVRSTVGAGDAMVAGIVAGHLKNLPFCDTARLATASSIQAISGIPIAEALPQIVLRNHVP